MKRVTPMARVCVTVFWLWTMHPKVKQNFSSEDWYFVHKFLRMQTQNNVSVNKTSTLLFHILLIQYSFFSSHANFWAVKIVNFNVFESMVSPLENESIGDAFLFSSNIYKTNMGMLLLRSHDNRNRNMYLTKCFSILLDHISII